jgi:hypothetical protein
MGRQSRLKWERRQAPPPSFHRPLETRWGTHPLARAFGGSLQGLLLAGALAVVCLVIGGVRIATAGASPDMDGFAGDALVFVGGFLLGGAAGGALAPVRHRIGGRRGQSIVMASVTFAVWTPLLNREADLGLAGSLVLWALFSAVYGLVFAKLFNALDPDPAPAQIEDLDPEFRSGRHRKFR